MLSNPLRDRFGVQSRLEYYTPQDLQEILKRAAVRMNIKLNPEGAFEIARRARGTPRIAHRLLRRVWDYATVHGTGEITAALADKGLLALEVDKLGLDRNDYRYLLALIERFQGGPVGVDTLAAATGEARDTLEDMIEPYLLQQGFIERTPRGRCALAAAYGHLGIKGKAPNQAELI
jgi:Holliday junction DNA helicase RuvB